MVYCAVRRNHWPDLKGLIDYLLQQEKRHYIEVEVEDETSALRIKESLQVMGGVIKTEIYKASEKDREMDSNDLLHGDR